MTGNNSRRYGSKNDLSRALRISLPAMMRNLKIEYVAEVFKEKDNNNKNNEVSDDSENVQDESLYVNRSQTDSDKEIYYNDSGIGPEEDGDYDDPWGSDFDEEDEYEDEDYDADSNGSGDSKTPLVKQDEIVRDHSNIIQPLYERLSYNTEWLAETMKETKKWLFIMPVKIAVATALLISLACLYNPYVDECEPENTFSDFSLIILSYIILQQLLDIILAATSLRGMKKALKSNTFEYIEEMKTLQPDVSQEYAITKGCTTYTDTDRNALLQTCNMGSKAKLYLDIDHDINSNYTHHMGASAGAVTSRDSVRTAMNVLIKKSKLFNRQMKKNKMPTLPKHQHEAYIDPIHEHSRGTVGFGGKFLITLNIIPLFSILFYIVVGANSITDLQIHLKEEYEKNPESFGDRHFSDLPVLCKATIGLNWMILITIFLTSFIRFIPVFFRVIKKATSRLSYKSQGFITS